MKRLSFVYRYMCAVACGALVFFPLTAQESTSEAAASETATTEVATTEATTSETATTEATTTEATPDEAASVEASAEESMAEGASAPTAVSVDELDDYEAYDGGKDSDKKKSAPPEIGDTRIPSKKRPKTPDSEKVRELDNADTENSREKNADTLKFGLESEITELLDTLTKNEDVRFTEDVYDLFESTKSVLVREKALGYFAKLEDPCLEDYAVTILDDPYDEKGSTVSACFSYVRAVKTKEAVNPVLRLIENENQDYFTNALDTIGEIGGDKEAVYLADFLDREDLSVAQRQSLVRVLGKIKATKTYTKLVELAKDSDENSFVRMYAAEAIGAMEKDDAVSVLSELYEDTDPNLRTYVVKGLAHFTKPDAQDVLIQATRDTYYKVRLEAISAIKEQNLQRAVPYLIYRAKNDPERVVKEACYPVIATLNTKEGNDYLIGQITDKKVADNIKGKIAAALLVENNAGESEILALAEECLKDDRKKGLRYTLGKEFAKYDRSSYADICAKYIESKDVSTIGTGLDMYARGRYASVTGAVQALADKYDPNAKTRNAMAQKASRILGISEEEAEKKAEAAKASAEAAKTAAKTGAGSQPASAATEPASAPTAATSAAASPAE